MIWAPHSLSSSTEIPFTEARVPTGMKMGVSIFPRAVSITPARALVPSFSATTLYSNILYNAFRYAFFRRGKRLFGPRHGMVFVNGLRQEMNMASP